MYFCSRVLWCVALLWSAVYCTIRYHMVTVSYGYHTLPYGHLANILVLYTLLIYICTHTHTHHLLGWYYVIMCRILGCWFVLVQFWRYPTWSDLSLTFSHFQDHGSATLRFEGAEGGGSLQAWSVWSRMDIGTHLTLADICKLFPWQALQVGESFSNMDELLSQLTCSSVQNDSKTWTGALWGMFYVDCGLQCQVSATLSGSAKVLAAFGTTLACFSFDFLQNTMTDRQLCCRSSSIWNQHKAFSKETHVVTFQLLLLHSHTHRER